MTDILIYHPETDMSVAVPAESVDHYRGSGWVLASEWAEHLELAARAAAQAEEQARPRAGKAGKDPAGGPAGGQAASTQEG